MSVEDRITIDASTYIATTRCKFARILKFTGTLNFTGVIEIESSAISVKGTVAMRTLRRVTYPVSGPL